MITEEQAWVTIGLGFLTAVAMYVDQGTWAGLVVPITLFILFAVANPGGDPDDPDDR